MLKALKDSSSASLASATAASVASAANSSSARWAFAAPSSSPNAASPAETRPAVRGLAQRVVRQILGQLLPLCGVGYLLHWAGAATMYMYVIPKPQSRRRKFQSLRNCFISLLLMLTTLTQFARRRRRQFWNNPPPSCQRTRPPKGVRGLAATAQSVCALRVLFMFHEAAGGCVGARQQGSA